MHLPGHGSLHSEPLHGLAVALLNEPVVGKFSEVSAEAVNALDADGPEMA